MTIALVIAGFVATDGDGVWDEFQKILSGYRFVFKQRTKNFYARKSR